MNVCNLKLKLGRPRESVGLSISRENASPGRSGQIAALAGADGTFFSVRLRRLQRSTAVLPHSLDKR